jgi:hypothetical protein
MKTRSIITGMCALVVYGLTLAIGLDQVSDARRDSAEAREKLSKLEAMFRKQGDQLSAAIRTQTKDSLGRMESDGKLRELQVGTLNADISKLEDLKKQMAEIQARPPADPLSEEGLRKMEALARLVKDADELKQRMALSR